MPVPRRWYRRGRGKAGPGCRRTKWRRLMAACPPPPSPGPATTAAATATTAPALEKGVSNRLAQTHLAGCAGIRDRGPGAPRGGMAVGRGRMAADGAGFGSSRLPRSLRGRAPTNGPSGQPPPPGASPHSRLPPRLDTPLDLHKGRSALCPIPLYFQGCSYLKKKKAGREEQA